MRMNEIIRKKRVGKGLTQEQVAVFLGVSAPAVNKWEKAVCYPDVTLLPALARLLDTDLNTLLCFKEDLCLEEIGVFLYELVETAQREGMKNVMGMAMDKIHEYPSCDNLSLQTALTLEGLMMLYVGETDNEDNEEYRAVIEKLYLQAGESKDVSVQSQAQVMLISKYMGRNELDRAAKLIEELPDDIKYNKKHLQANLCTAQGDFQEAARLIEEKILSEVGGVQAALFALEEIALKDQRISDARYIADVAKKTTDLFGLWEYGTYVADFQFCVDQKDSEGCLRALKKMLSAMKKPWKPHNSPLYKHIQTKENNRNQGEFMLPGILKDLEDPDNHAYDFLRENKKFIEIISDHK